MNTLKQICVTVLGIITGLAAFLFFLFKKPSSNNDAKAALDALNASIQANEAAINSEADLREQIKKETKDAMDADVSQDSTINFFNGRKV